MPKQIGKHTLWSRKELAELLEVGEVALKKSSIPFVKAGPHNYVSEEKLADWFRLGNKVTK